MCVLAGLAVVGRDDLPCDDVLVHDGSLRLGLGLLAHGRLVDSKREATRTNVAISFTSRRFLGDLANMALKPVQAEPGLHLLVPSCIVTL